MSHLRQLRHAPVAWAGFWLVLAIQALLANAAATDDLNGWLTTFGLSRAGFLSGQIWQIASYGLIHGGWWHAGLNAVFMLLIGARVEHIAGHRTLLLATLAGVLGGGLGHLLLGAGLLVGLSGGCMALLLLVTTLSPQSRMMPLPVSGRSLGLGLLLAAALLSLLNPALGVPGAALLGAWLATHGLADWFQIGHACHLGGGLAGWLYGRWLLRAPVTLHHLRRARTRRERRMNSLER